MWMGDSSVGNDGSQAAAVGVQRNRESAGQDTWPQMLSQDERIATIMRQVDEGGVRWVRVATTDLSGVLRAKLIAADRLGRVLRDGQAWGARLLHVDLAEDLDPDTEYDALTHTGNCTMLPDPSTFRILPWQPDTAIVLAEPVYDDGRPAVSARSALRTVLRRAAAAGYCIGAGSEIEFHLYRRVEGTVRPVTDDRAFFSNRALAAAESILVPLREALAALGLPVSSLENEHGAGQLELNLGPLQALEAADAAALARAAVKEVAERHGYLATFMAKPSNGREANTCGYHLHQALYDAAGANLCWDSDDPDGISLLLRHYIAGQLAHAPALVACASPTITGYKRYQPSTFAPVHASWAFDDRAAMVRVMRERGEDTRIENRLGESAANPYLLLASQLAAGLDGIRRRLDLPAPLVYGGHEPEPQGLRLPRDLPAAIAALRDDAVLATDLGPDTMRSYLGVLANTWRRYQAFVTDWEIAEYREVL